MSKTTSNSKNTDRIKHLKADSCLCWEKVWLAPFCLSVWLSIHRLSFCLCQQDEKASFQRLGPKEMLNKSWWLLEKRGTKKKKKHLQASGRKREERAVWLRAQQLECRVFCMQEERWREIEEQWGRYKAGWKKIREDLTRIELSLDRRRTGWGQKQPRRQAVSDI